MNEGSQIKEKFQEVCETRDLEKGGTGVQCRYFCTSQTILTPSLTCTRNLVDSLGGGSRIIPLNTSPQEQENHKMPHSFSTPNPPSSEQHGTFQTLSPSPPHPPCSCHEALGPQCQQHVVLPSIADNWVTLSTRKSLFPGQASAPQSTLILEMGWAWGIWAALLHLHT